MPRKKLLGYLAAVSVVFIWSSWLIISRLGVHTSLTIYDLAAIRFGLSGLIVLPFVIYFKTWRTISLAKALIVAFSIGPIYALLAFGGFSFSPAFHGGVFMNGFLPLITVFLSFLIGQKITISQLLGSILILFGSMTILFDTQNFFSNSSLFGDILFVLSAICLSFFMVLVKRWDLQYGQILFSICLVNALIYLPVWFFFLPIGTQSFGDLLEDRNVVINILFQGFVPNLMGLFLTAYSAKMIGPSKASALLAAVPITGALLGSFFLSESPTFFGWLSLLIVSIGILLVVIKGREV